MSDKPFNRSASHLRTELAASEAAKPDDGRVICDGCGGEEDAEDMTKCTCGLLLCDHCSAVGCLCHDDLDEPGWVDSHSVSCYFCGRQVDERECTPADDLNDNDGGDCCPDCRKSRATEAKED